MISTEFIFGDDVYADNYYLDCPCVENWEFINEFPNYSISDHGRVWSNISNGFLKQYSMNGYHLGVGLRRNHQRYSSYIHRLVAETFIPNPNKYPIVRHLDDDPTHNHVSNLKWGTQKDNVADAMQNGIHMGCASVSVRATHSNGNIEDFVSQNEASRNLGVSVSGISFSIDTNRPLKGFLFERLDQ